MNGSSCHGSDGELFSGKLSICTKLMAYMDTDMAVPVVASLDTAQETMWWEVTPGLKGGVCLKTV